MATRTRTRSSVNYALINYVKTPDVSVETESMVEVEVGRKKTNVIHWKFDLSGGTGHWLTDYAARYDVVKQPLMRLDALRNLYSSDLQALSLTLNRNKLSSTNEFGLIQFFAELDETAALFTKQFWLQLNYGGAKWGVAPFVSEMKKLLSFIVKSAKTYGSVQQYEDQIVKEFSYKDVDGIAGCYCNVELKVTVRNTGSVTLEVAQEAQRFLDSLGFHPDLKTTWDLVPLSFMVDWFIPVGNFIDSLHQQGWVRSIPFKGWTTYKVEAKISRTGQRSSTGTIYGQLTNTYTDFRRFYVSDTLTLPEKKFDAGKSPTLTNLVDTLYLLTKGFTSSDLPFVKKKRKPKALPLPKNLNKLNKLYKSSNKAANVVAGYSVVGLITYDLTKPKDVQSLPPPGK